MQFSQSGQGSSSFMNGRVPPNFVAVNEEKGGFVDFIGCQASRGRSGHCDTISLMISSSFIFVKFRLF